MSVTAINNLPNPRAYISAAATLSTTSIAVLESVTLSGVGAGRDVYVDSDWLLMSNDLIDNSAVIGMSVNTTATIQFPLTIRANLPKQATFSGTSSTHYGGLLRLPGLLSTDIVYFLAALTLPPGTPPSVNVAAFILC